MVMNKIIETSVGPNYGHEQNNRNICRGRFIVPTADLSALAGFSALQMNKLNSIITPKKETVIW